VHTVSTREWRRKEMFSVTLLTPFLPPVQPFAAKGSGRSGSKTEGKNFSVVIVSKSLPAYSPSP
jgi:hypothetical protein